ncbi:hypothetical protein NQZ68_025205 [Dissostichus eleginoides]|nr:hypothetical protein NQZ68_025205 [Dissostichus eleginoides]
MPPGQPHCPEQARQADFGGEWRGMAGEQTSELVSAAEEVGPQVARRHAWVGALALPGTSLRSTTPRGTISLIRSEGGVGGTREEDEASQRGKMERCCRQAFQTNTIPRTRSIQGDDWLLWHKLRLRLLGTRLPRF